VAGNTYRKDTTVFGKTKQNLHEVLDLVDIMEQRAVADNDLALQDFVDDVREALLNVCSIIHGNGEVL
jgi:hypothetical protein